MLPITPLSYEARKTQAARAAEMDAAAKLTEQLGEVYVAQDIRVENLMLSHQSAQMIVQGILVGGIQYEKPKWLSARHCVVEATLEVSATDLERLKALFGPVR
jgi:hypothetical protein